MWFFSCPKKIVFGPNSLNYLNQLNMKKVFIVTDKMVVELGFAELVTKGLDKRKIEYQIYDGCEPDAPLQTVKEGAKKCADFKPDTIIGLGGGSSMDTAKVIYFLYERPEEKIQDLTAFRTDIELGKKARFILIPTTSGTGAEVTWAAILSDPAEDRKLLQSSRELIPEIAICDPALPANMPKKLTMGTGLDVLVHAIEGYTSGFKNIYSDITCIGAVRLVLENLEKAVNDPDNAARDNMHNAATIAGLGFGNSQAGACHAIGHTLGAFFHKHHGACVGLALPYMMQYNSNNDENITKQYAELARRAADIWEKDDKKACTLLIKRIKDLIANIDGPRTLQDLGITKEDIESNLDKIIQITDEDACTTTNRPIPESEDYVKIYKYMLEGKDVDF
ncbi:MAG: iron-containing alcohol dehydrogenase [Candidatus Helarchaeota archaeon]